MSEELAPRSMAEVCKKQREEIARVKVIAARNIGRALEAEAALAKALADVERLRDMIKTAEAFDLLACDNCGQWQYQDCTCGVGYQWYSARKAALKETKP